MMDEQNDLRLETNVAEPHGNERKRLCCEEVREEKEYNEKALTVLFCYDYICMDEGRVCEHSWHEGKTKPRLYIVVMRPCNI